MKVTTTLGPVSVLSVSGDIDASTYYDLVWEADEVLNSAHVKLVLDLGGVDFVSSGGLVALQSIAENAASRGGKLVLCGVGKQVSLVFMMTGFDKVFEIYPNVDEAIASIG